MEIGPGAQHAMLTMKDKHGNRHVLEVTSKEKDLGVTVTSDLDPLAQCKAAASTGNRVLGALCRTFITRELSVWKKLYVSLIRPHLEYASSIWNPTEIGDALLIETVQRRATKRIRSIRKLKYKQRLERLELTTLEVRRQRGDLIQIYKVLKGLEIVVLTNGTQPLSTVGYTRGNSRRLVQESHSCTVRSRFLFVRAIPLWNQLPEAVVSAESLNAFKARLDEYLRTNPGGSLNNKILNRVA
jgi:hypothetical protein